MRAGCRSRADANPELKELVAEASRALARLDAARLEELALSCEALNRDLDADERGGESGDLARQAGRRRATWRCLAGAGCDASQSERDEAAARVARGSPGIQRAAQSASRRLTSDARRAAMGTINSAFSLMAGALECRSGGAERGGQQRSQRQHPGLHGGDAELAGECADSDWRDLGWRWSDGDRRNIRSATGCWRSGWTSSSNWRRHRARG